MSILPIEEWLFCFKLKPMEKVRAQVVSISVPRVYLHVISLTSASEHNRNDEIYE
jgi:hypothetical protein